ncbi:hypothetical protein CY34DRAFT_808274 [Suillus luteus UH-Slu-Lm8-n1]|uniref:Uncharacterized protein n=1 Tax=Suillus luteus UH-Slu-Lm8-n1 TaxID=930992 RepID=A0A0D0B6C4_9AGAM|nr:hypothetical protein CY34DRAFT_808274 [Suillus luteus UH-Slu-Lm8-n1]
MRELRQRLHTGCLSARYHPGFLYPQLACVDFQRSAIKLSRLNVRPAYTRSDS